MSEIGVHIHFHDGGLAKLAIFHGYVTTVQCIHSKTPSGGGWHPNIVIVKWSRMALMKYLTLTKQKAAVRTSLSLVRDLAVVYYYCL